MRDRKGAAERLRCGTIIMRSDTINSVDQLDEILSEPAPALISALSRIDGDILILGAAGKMGPTLARLARRAADEAGKKRRVIAVSRFGSGNLREQLERWDIRTIAADLLDESQLNSLPDAPNVIFMAGMKFGSTGQESLTWAMNTLLPALVAKRYAQSRIVAFSTGNIYGLSPVVRGGSVETDPLNPAGEYAMSCLGRERMFEHFSRKQGTKVCLFRLNYACEMRYGVLMDLGRRVWEGQPIDLAMGHFNVIWQGDANAIAIQALEHAASPPFILNVTGPELLSTRTVCERYGQLMDRKPVFIGSESADALLNNSALSQQLFGRPRIGVEHMMQWATDWIRRGGESLNKPTHFEVRDGKF